MVLMIIKIPSIFLVQILIASLPPSIMKYFFSTVVADPHTHVETCVSHGFGKLSLLVNFQTPSSIQTPYHASCFKISVIDFF